MLKRLLNKVKSHLTSSSTSLGFTLIELLIVIVIIGILAGVLIAVINPTQQQNRARDANVQSTINKVVLATQGFVSAYGRVPDEVEFLASLSNATSPAATCGTAGAFDCTFTLSGNALNTVGCSVGGWRGADGSAGQCYYRFYRNNAGWTGNDAGRFRVYGRSYGLATRVFVYDSADGVMRNCLSTVDIDAIANVGADANCQ